MRREIVGLVIAQSLAFCACSDQGSRVPTAPTGAATIATSTPLSGEQIKGKVFDTGQRVVAGALVEVLDGPQAGVSTTTNATGEFELRGTFDDTTRFRAAKEGHVSAINTLLPSCERCNPHRWIYFNLDVLAPPVQLAGNYVLTLTADTCANLPAEARTRSYDVTITPSTYRPATAFELTVTGGSLLEGFRRGWMNVAGDFVSIGTGDWHGTPGLVEQLAPNSYVGFDGGAEATVTTSPVETISASFWGLIEHCVLKTDMGPTYYCGLDRAVVRTQCNSTRHHLTLTRR